MNKTNNYSVWMAGVFCLGCLTITSPARSQIVPDTTLPSNTVVIPSRNTIRIEGGTRVGPNLFHSFDEFSVRTGTSAFFNNVPEIRNIFSRVTGGKISNIDGLIGANGAASLFLINPSGIVFGPNARLDIGGSFIGTSASSIEFINGSEFSAANPQTGSLLTINIPIGLSFRENPGSIRVIGIGHGVTADNLLLFPLNRGNSDLGLRVKPGNTLALVGGDVSLRGGTVAAEHGRIELGSVGSGESVSINPVPVGWTFDYEGVQNFGDIRLSQQALADASGDIGSEIQVQGSSVALTDGSIILIQNQGKQPTGNIQINASESIELIGATPDGRLSSSLNNQPVADGDGGDIAVSARRLVLQGGGAIDTRTFGAGTGGDILIDASESVEAIGFSSDLSIVSAIVVGTLNSGDGGDITVFTERLTVADGAIINSGTTGTGNAGDVRVNATDSVQLIGAVPDFPTGSSASSSTFGVGEAGNLIINTRQLEIRDGARVDTSTFASGPAGNIIINATESVELSGKFPGALTPSAVISSANILDENTRELIGLPPQPSGDSKNVIINTSRLRVTDEAQVTVRNDGTGDAGSLTINARSILLNREGALTAFSESGEGGNISLGNVRVLRMRRNSEISAEAREGKEDAGNITIDADIIVGLEDSDINANALGGNGGNINIRTQGIFGSEFRQEDTSKSDITASSQFGVDGTVQINDPDVEPDEGLIELPENLVDAATILAADTCAQAVGSDFFITGKGGLPRNPNESLDSEELMVGLVNSAPSNIGKLENNIQLSSHSEEQQFVPAQGWIFKENGEVILIGYNPSYTGSQRGYNLTHGCNLSTEVMGDR